MDWDRDIRRTSNQRMQEYRRKMTEYEAGQLSDPPKRPKGTYEWAKEVPFAYREIRLSDIFSIIRVDILLILAFNAIFFMAAYLSFLRYDVR